MESVSQRLFGTAAWRDTVSALAEYARDPAIARRCAENQAYRRPAPIWISRQYWRLAQARLAAGDSAGATMAGRTAAAFQRL